MGEDYGIFYLNLELVCLFKKISVVILSSVVFVLIFYKKLCLLNFISSFVVSMPFYLTNLSANTAPPLSVCWAKVWGDTCIEDVWGVGVFPDVGRGGG